MARILVIEDDGPIRGMLDDFFVSEGFDVLLAEDGHVGVARARFERPDVVLMDIMLPVLDGVSAIRQLRADAATRDLPIVAMTANPVVLRRTDVVPADAIVAKPFDLEVLLGIVQEQLDPRLSVAGRLVG